MRLTILIIALLTNGIKSQIPAGEVLTDFTTENVDAAVSDTCKKSLNLLVDNLFALQLWSIQMVDASSKLPTGLLKGNLIELGNYEECLSVKKQASPDVAIRGKFCIGSISLRNFTKLDLQRFIPADIQMDFVAHNAEFDLFPKFSLCIPDSCTGRDLQALFHNYVKFDDGHCYTNYSPKELDGIAIIAIYVFSCIISIIIISTIYDIYLEYNNKSSWHPVILAFSVYSNGGKLFKTGYNPSHLTSLHGLKAISMIWVVLGHVYMSYILLPLNNYVDMFYWMKSRYSQLVTAAPFAVDTFLLMGGFLMVYQFLNVMNTGTKFNIFLYYLHRYLRLTPSLGALLLAHVALFNRFGSGPFWINTDKFLVETCKQNWPSALLYIQNYANPESICLPQTWYLSVDMQLYILSPLILMLLRKWPVYTYLGIILAVLISTLVNFLIGWNFQMRATLGGQVNEMKRVEYMTHYYFPTHTRLGPYLIGIVLGGVVHRLKQSPSKLRLRKINVLPVILASFSIMLWCVFAGHALEFAAYNRFENAAFMAIARPLWALAVSAIIFLCIMGFGGPINSFLSLPVFEILSRLSYSIYLVHYPCIFMMNYNRKSTLNFNIIGSLHKFCGDLMCSIIIGTIWTLTFESPVICIEKLYLRKYAMRAEKTP